MHLVLTERPTFNRRGGTKNLVTVQPSPQENHDMLDLIDVPYAMLCTWRHRELHLCKVRVLIRSPKLTVIP